jgi:hypothetical protein
MTKEQKKAKRASRHEVQRRLTKAATRSLGMFSTDAQIRAGIKQVADLFFAARRRAPMAVRDVLETDPQT